MTVLDVDELVAQFDRLKHDFGSALESVSGEQEIRLLQARFLGRKGQLSELMKALGRLPPEARAAVGVRANEARAAIEALAQARLDGLAAAAQEADLRRRLDVTLPGRPRARGTLHPLTIARQEIESIFLRLGFEIRTGPWIETEWNNFDALNTPSDHPARDMQDTFFVEGGRILRSHTSPVQIRTMLKLVSDLPPEGPLRVKIIAPGNVFRRDDDATHTPMFPQVEGLHVGEQVSFEDLKATLIHFVRQFFGPEMQIRLRPSFFPFTEPSAEVDATCFQCAGRGQRAGGVSCRLCKGTGWIEIGGCGMVHPNVFRAVGLVAEKDPRCDVTGYAFGIGLSRMAMLKFGINDLRLFYENDLRFLRQFAAS